MSFCFQPSHLISVDGSDLVRITAIGKISVSHSFGKAIIPVGLALKGTEAMLHGGNVLSDVQEESYSK